jgi:hypothetical protein
MRATGRLSAHVQRFSVVAVASAAVLVASAAGAVAAAGYGPPPPAPGPAPGGYSAVVTSQTIGRSGRTIGPVRVGTCWIRLRVPTLAFPSKVQVTLTKPDLADIGNGGFAGYRAVCGAGIKVQHLNGSTYEGTFYKYLALRMSSHSISDSSIAVVWNGLAFVTVRTSSVGSRRATVHFNTDRDVAVLSS